jgi:hypothetical protein
MLTASISILALIGLSILGYVAYNYRKLAIDNHLKFITTREFAESASKEILDLKSNISSMAQAITEYTILNLELQAKLNKLTPKAKQPKQAKPTNGKNNTPLPTMKGGKPKTK